MKKLLVFVLTVCFVCGILLSTTRAADTAVATVSATITSVESVEFDRDTNSVTRGSATQLIFDRRDDDDVPNGDAGYMYAPYRSETGKNWHIAAIAANGSSMVLSLGVNLTGIDASKLKVWCGGFFPPGATDPITGTASTDWEFANGWQRSLNQPFVGTASFNYQLNISDVVAGTYAGTLTLTLTSS